jgi:enoyl-[acyl-carrier-protein] reductase (NADH)
MLDARARKSGVSAEEIESRDYAEGSPRANSIGRMVDASEIATVTAFLCSDKAWAVTGEVIAADGGGGNSVYY